MAWWQRRLLLRPSRRLRPSKHTLRRLSRLTFAAAVTAPLPGLVNKPMVSVTPLSMVCASMAPLRAFPMTLRRLHRLRRLTFAAAVTAPRPGLVNKPMVSVTPLSTVCASMAPLRARLKLQQDKDLS
jgi:hypothetical protein